MVTPVKESTTTFNCSSFDDHESDHRIIYKVSHSAKVHFLTPAGVGHQNFMEKRIYYIENLSHEATAFSVLNEYLENRSISDIKAISKNNWVALLHMKNNLDDKFVEWELLKFTKDSLTSRNFKIRIPESYFEPSEYGHFKFTPFPHFCITEDNEIFIYIDRVGDQKDLVAAYSFDLDLKKCNPQNFYVTQP